MDSLTKDLWSGTLKVEAGDSQVRFTIESKSTGNAKASVDILKDDMQEFFGELLSMTYGVRGGLPSAHQIDDAVTVYFWKAQLNARVIGVHFYAGKVKYDLEVFDIEQDYTRIYNVDSAFVEKFVSSETV